MTGVPNGSARKTRVITNRSSNSSSLERCPDFLSSFIFFADRIQLCLQRSQGLVDGRSDTVEVVGLDVEVKIDESPVFQESVDSHNRAGIAILGLEKVYQVLPAGCGCEVDFWVLSVNQDYVVSEVFVGLGGLARFSHKKLRKIVFFNLVDSVQIKPAGAGWDNHGVVLREKMIDPALKRGGVAVVWPSWVNKFLQ